MKTLKCTQILKKSLKHFKAHWLWICVTAALTVLLSFVVGFIFGAVLELIMGAESVASVVIVNVLSWCVAAWTCVLWTSIGMRLGRGKFPKISAVLPSFQQWKRIMLFFVFMFVALVLIVMAAAVPPVLVGLVMAGSTTLPEAVSIAVVVVYGCIVVGVFWTLIYSYTLVANLIVEGHKSVIGAMRLSSRLMNGMKLRLFVADLALIGTLVLTPAILAFVTFALVVEAAMSPVVILGWLAGGLLLLAVVALATAALPLNRGVLYVHLEKSGVLAKAAARRNPVEQCEA